MVDADFFAQQTEQSHIKAEIVAKYFDAWANVIVGFAKSHGEDVGYIDLFAGPGRYDDGAKSTPLLVLQRAIANENLRTMLRAFFNDREEANCTALKAEISRIPGIETLCHLPTISNLEVGDELADRLENVTLIPSLVFLDPWGYKGVSLRLIDCLLRGWGCDCILFFNYSRINMHIQNEAQWPNVKALFGEARAKKLRAALKGLAPFEREMMVIEKLAEAMKDIGGEYVLPFCFKNAHGERTSHHLILVSKHVRGYEIMKGIMSGYSSESPQGVPSFEYSSVNTKMYPMLFELSRPLDELGEMLLEHFSGQTLTMQQIYEQHHVGRPYIKRNYKAALVELEAEGKIVAVPPALERRKRGGQPTFADHVVVTFP